VGATGRAHGDEGDEERPRNEPAHESHLRPKLVE
jgi:hypothetical protein